MKSEKFKPGKSITIFFIFFASVFFALGLWQIERGQAKANIILEFENNLKKDASVFSEDSKKWDKVFINGTWDNSRQMLVDNVINRGVAGYKVLTPFKISNSDTLILVDRGWIPREASRQTLPNIDINNIKEKVFGTLENPELGFVLSDILVSGDWPKVSQTKNLNVISKEYNDPLAQFILVADPILKNSLEYLKIIPTNMMPSKHYGYSAQWFTMFLVLCFMYIWLGYKKNEK
ncbi:SURF1 family protein [Gammaproteobacteria bacterium]|jgi:surfeit locus 1 family protein|nr:SURF1 family protein [Gammaproteobacteria bacterium]